MGLTDAAAKFNAYSGRRGFIGVAETLEPKLDITERYAWATGALRELHPTINI